MLNFFLLILFVFFSFLYVGKKFGYFKNFSRFYDVIFFFFLSFLFLSFFLFKLLKTV